MGLSPKSPNDGMQLPAMRAALESQVFTVRGKEYRNVIGRFGVGKGSKVVVGAHYDSFGTTPGADDNASGVAALVELAYLLSDGQLRSRKEPRQGRGGLLLPSRALGDPGSRFLRSPELLAFRLQRSHGHRHGLLQDQGRNRWPEWIGTRILVSVRDRIDAG